MNMQDLAWLFAVSNYYDTFIFLDPVTSIARILPKSKATAILAINRHIL
jgi:hypothetical protein